ncbi:Dbl-like domain-containing protein [Cylindrobasidium torrendii FP15055 ss-10]|uniref:Dbl-like domain-containing protein n=1 Tax=Cylindrobasidium torrendii FP15055 ss-10 TaxID=1314674 RepID=A0A0D7BD09_9AGAR|nr:Dbl-like domain-containing protein [Cylindrobasidium torrendii FP15055 ss-10]
MRSPPCRNVDGTSAALYDSPSSPIISASTQGTSLDYDSASALNRTGSIGSFNSYAYSDNIAGPSNPIRISNGFQNGGAGFQDDHALSYGLHSDIDDYWEGDPEDDESRFINFSLLSHIAVQLRDKVPRGTHVKGSIPYPKAFTGKDIVSTVQSLIQRELAINHGISTADRRAALQVARSLLGQLFFYEVEWGGGALQDGVEDVYMFLDDLPGERPELPNGVVTVLTKCYTPSCDESSPCYAPRCPRRGEAMTSASTMPEEASAGTRQEWTSAVPSEVLISLPASEVNRQTIIHKLIDKEEQYIHDLDIVETVFIQPLRTANPPVVSDDVDEFIDTIFGNILDLRECNRHLLEILYVRQREQAPVIQVIGDVFLDAATVFRIPYPTYIGHHPVAEKRLKEELSANSTLRVFLEKCERNAAQLGEPMRTLKHFLDRPSEHLQKYPVLLDAIFNETAEGNPDGEFLMEAIGAIKNLRRVAQLQTFQSSMGKPQGAWHWHKLVSPEVIESMTKSEKRRQASIFELIETEMGYVKDLENIEHMYISPLRKALPFIIHPDRLDQFIQDVFHNFAELHAHHRRLVDKLHEIQREEHPHIKSITAAVCDAALNFRDAYLDYIPNYPIAAHRITEEMASNPDFNRFVEAAIKHPDAGRHDMKNFINRPIPRLLRYNLLLKAILDETPPGHPDRVDIPELLEMLKALGKETEPGVQSAKQKVELWGYNSNIVFKPGEAIDMDLLDTNRSLIHTGRLLRQPDGGIDFNGWSELSVLLFDNYCKSYFTCILMVMTKSRKSDNVTKYHVNRRPIPLDLLTLVNFTDPPVQRGTGLLRNLRGTKDGGTVDPTSPHPNRQETGSNDSRSVYPCTIHCNGRLGGNFLLYAESAQARQEWKEKLEEAVGLRRVVQESNKVFEIETLSADTFLVPSIMAGPAWNLEQAFTGKVTCSVPFKTPDGRALVAIGCAEGVWIGFRHDSRSMRRVLHLKSVTQCAMMEDFGIFLVLADKCLFAYHIEALVPSSPASHHANQSPQRLNGNKEVQFFSVGQLLGRTLVIWMKKKGMDSTFYMMEPVIEKINERTKSSPAISRFGFRSLQSNKSEWFREYRDFLIPSESFDLVFLRSKVVILHAKGFEIMDVMNLQSKTIPNRAGDPLSVALHKRCDGCRPIGMFRITSSEFLLCYNEFGVYVNKRGDPSRPIIVEWEGTAVRVALHSPYILLFDTRFIEVRHIHTGRLAQIIPGNDLACIWDGRGASTLSPPSPDDTNPAEERMTQEARIHVVSSAPDSLQNGRQTRAISQHVFELIPTIPLYLPGSLASPSNVTYFPTSYSPPHSPMYRLSGLSSAGTPGAMPQDSYFSELA